MVKAALRPVLDNAAYEKAAQHPGYPGIGDNAGQPCPGAKHIAVAATKYNAIAICDDGTTWTWGENAEGVLGDGTTTNRLYPTMVGFSVNGLAATTGTATAANTRNLTAEGIRDWVH